MNKLDALIAELEPPPHLSNALARVPLVKAAAIRRILEAVRVDLVDSEKLCNRKDKKRVMCERYKKRSKLCHDCPLLEHAATRAALEQL